MKKLLSVISIAVVLGSLSGCATTPVSKVNKVSLIDLSARSIGVSEKTVSIKNIEVKNNFDFVPPPEVYEWDAETGAGVFHCKTANGYLMSSPNGFGASGGCVKTAN